MMRVGKQRYKLSYCLKRWFMSQFSSYNKTYNRQCAFGIRCSAYKGNKCLNRFHPIRCGECWRADGLKRKHPDLWLLALESEIFDKKIFDDKE